MPDSHEVLAGLTRIANEYQLLAILWHGVILGFIIALLSGYRPSLRTAGLALAVPLLTVACVSWLDGNPFNGGMFTLAVIVLGLLAARLPERRIRIARIEPALAGVVLIAFGLVYPHFLETDTWFAYLYAAPVGLVPCPTLSLVIGFALLFGGLGSRAISGVLVAMGLFYGLFGTLRLGVELDWGLVGGALALLLSLAMAKRAKSD